MCREQQDAEILERACSTLENASRHQGGVQPELLFQVITYIIVFVRPHVTG